jgi:hypothetical protein
MGMIKNKTYGGNNNINNNRLKLSRSLLEGGCMDPKPEPVCKRRNENRWCCLEKTAVDKEIASQVNDSCDCSNNNTGNKS